MEILIEQLKPEDIPAAKKLVAQVITDAFQKEGINLELHRKDLLGAIMAVQMKFDPSPESRYRFFTAKVGEDLVGTSGFGPLSRPVLEAIAGLNEPQENLKEILSIYIKPEYQGQGIGTRLFHTALEALKGSGHNRFALNTGYENSKNFWKSKLGKPTIILPNYYRDSDCLVWLKDVKDFDKLSSAILA